jgi:uncharacterized membrane protein
MTMTSLLSWLPGIVMRAGHGEEAVLDGSGLACPAAARVFGFRPLPANLESGQGLVGFGIVSDPGVGAAMFEDMPHLEPGSLELLRSCEGEPMIPCGENRPARSGRDTLNQGGPTMPVRPSWAGTILALGLLAGAVPAGAAPVGPALAQEEAGSEPQVRAVLFYSPACPHCHEVMENHLPPLLDRYGEGLRIVAVNVDTPQGQTLYQAVVGHYRIPPDRLGVPALVVGDRVLVGSWEIPSELPGLVEGGLARGGVDWPPVREVRAYLALRGIASDEPAELESWMLAGAEGEQVAFVLGADRALGVGGALERFRRDPVGNGAAVVVLLGMLAAVAMSVRDVAGARPPRGEWPRWVVPVLALLGAGVAAYLAFVEVTGTEAVCGPVGDCNRVQLSPYARIAGVPVGVLGLVGYLTLGSLWVVAVRSPARRTLMHRLVWAMALGGVAFSIYLTFLEPFVIGATCVWCLNSAVVMTLILLVATPTVRLPSGGAVASRGRRRARERERARRA